MQPNIFALLVGINTYPKESKVDRLNAPLNDLEKMTALLTNVYKCPLQNIKVLRDSEATRVGIINSFTNHLCNNPNLKSGDTVIFYYGGHGSFARTANEFRRLQSTKWDETIVCYDSRLPGTGNYDLADKEIAVLISRVPKEIEVIIIADSCHSGDITRTHELSKSKALKARYQPINQENPRDLNTYLLPGDTFYTEKGPTELYIPNRQHIKLTACLPTEFAMENKVNGIFTINFVDILTKKKGAIAYKQLQGYLAAVIHSEASEQTPCFGFPKNFNTQQTFIRNQIMDTLPQLHIIPKNNQWILNYGAIHGLPADEDKVERIQVAVHRNAKDQYKFLGNVYLSKVGMNHSYLNKEAFDELYMKYSANDVEKCTKILFPEEHFTADIITIPPNLLVNISGSTEKKKWLFEQYDSKKYPFINLDQSDRLGRYQIQFPNENEISLINTENNIPVFNLLYNSASEAESKARVLFQNIAKIEAWERLLKLNNPIAPLGGLTSLVEVTFERLDTSETYQDLDELEIHYQNIPIPFQIKVKNISKRKLFIAVVHLNRFYGTTILYYCTEFSKDNLNDVIVVQEGILGIKEGDPATEALNIFKVIISTSRFDDYHFQQDGIQDNKSDDADRGDSNTSQSIYYKEEETWFTKILKVRLKR